jgi:hypothetical protein
VNTVRDRPPRALVQTLNPVVCYARKIVVSADELAIGDAIILHSLGVLWDHSQI